VSLVQKSTADLLASGNVDALLALHRATFGGLRMEGEGGEGAGAGGEGGEGKPAPKTFSQEDMNATVARAESAAKTKAQADLAAALGVSVEEAKQIIADRKATDDAKKSEAERAAEAAKTAQTEAENLRREAATERHHARLERALSKAGLDVDNAPMLRAGLAALDVPTDADADAVKAAVDKLKTDAPALFGATTGAGGGTHSDTGGQGGSKKAVQAGDFGKDGAAEAARRFEKEKASV
jgi:hypothetical protein